MWFEQEKNNITLFNEAGAPGPEVGKLELVMRLKIEVPDMKGSVHQLRTEHALEDEVTSCFYSYTMLEREEMWMDRMIYTWVSEEREMYFVFLPTLWKEISQQSIIRFWKLTFKYWIFLQKQFVHDMQTNCSIRFAGRCWGLMPSLLSRLTKVR